MDINTIDLEAKFGLFAEHWSPKIVGELNGLAKLQGEFVWHKHDNEDELFLVVRGVLIIEFRDKKLEIAPGQLVIVPKGVEHKPVAHEEVWVMLFEPASTLNTGDADVSELTKEHLDKI